MWRPTFNAAYRINFVDVLLSPHRLGVSTTYDEQPFTFLRSHHECLSSAWFLRGVQFFTSLVASRFLDSHSPTDPMECD
ncbi:hypothetical protein QCA50_012593 [Cerrena zonata]|uniref:Uncharacterized protein n=1 Tax=Cerrena zonata TaxID=2478898 RepID=A0AAW0FXY0_9APHY